MVILLALEDKRYSLAAPRWCGGHGQSGFSKQTTKGRHGACPLLSILQLIVLPNCCPKRFYT